MAIFDKFRSNEEYLDLGHQEEVLPDKFTMEVERIENITDTERIQKKVRSGSIMLVKIRDLRTRDMGELKRAITKVKKTVTAINGDMVGIGEDWVVVTPGHAKVHRADEEN